MARPKTRAASPAAAETRAPTEPPKEDVALTRTIIEIERLLDQRDLAQAAIDERIEALTRNGWNPAVVRLVLDRRAQSTQHRLLEQYAAAAHLAERVKSAEPFVGGAR
jgi:hypothetical protein